MPRVSDETVVGLAAEVRGVIVNRAIAARDAALQRDDHGDRLVLQEARGDVGALAVSMARSFTERMLRPTDGPRFSSPDWVLASTIEGLGRRTAARIFEVALTGFNGGVITSGPKRGQSLRLGPISEVHPDGNKIPRDEQDPFLRVDIGRRRRRSVTALTVSLWTPQQPSITATGSQLRAHWPQR